MADNVTTNWWFWWLHVCPPFSSLTSSYQPFQPSEKGTDPGQPRSTQASPSPGSCKAALLLTFVLNSKSAKVKKKIGNETVKNYLNDSLLSLLCLIIYGQDSFEKGFIWTVRNLFNCICFVTRIVCLVCTHAIEIGRVFWPVIANMLFVSIFFFAGNGFCEIVRLWIYHVLSFSSLTNLHTCVEMWYGRIFVVVHCKQRVINRSLEACLSFKKWAPKSAKNCDTDE